MQVGNKLLLVGTADVKKEIDYPTFAS
jgi:hypothetical protein